MTTQVRKVFRENCPPRVRAFAAAALAIAGLAAPLGAQTPIPAPFPDPATCPIKAGIKSFVLEDDLFANSFISLYSPTLPASTIAVFLDKTKKVRTHFTFNTTDMLFHAYSIPVALNAPLISPDTTDFVGLAIAQATVKVDKIYTVCYPRPTIMVSGPVTSSTHVYGDLTGLPHGFAFSYDPTISYDPVKNNVYNAADVVITDAGINLVSSLQAAAIITPATVTANITGSPSITTMYREIVLDGTSSLSDVGNMTYQWSAAPGVDVGIIDPISPQTRIMIGGAHGDYPVTLTVTTPFDSATSTVTVHYIKK